MSKPIEEILTPKPEARPHIYAYSIDDNAHKGGGLNFPGEAAPDYWDFVYFSFVIGMTSQVSDVAVTSRVIRRMVTAHGVVSFIFNATRSP